jgi:hypothetical protein
MAIISPGNTKLGKIPNISYSPPLTCKGRTCLTDGCYAMKAYRRYPNIRTAWDINTQEWIYNPDYHRKVINDYLCRRKPRAFRWMVGGDVIDLEHSQCIVWLAGQHHNTMFRLNTKRPALFARKTIPFNLFISHSAWPGDKIRRGRFPIAWVQDGSETRMPEDAFICPSDCSVCNFCFEGHKEQDLIYHKH